jgi:hypothetical protein
MACLCCSENGLNKPEVGTCPFGENACNYLTYGHGENCTHCDIFYCYKHQHEHAFDNGLKPIKAFPRTARIFLEFMSEMKRQSSAVESPRIVLTHGVYFAKKLRNPEIEKNCHDMLSLIEENRQDRLTSLTEPEYEIMNRLYQNLTDALHSLEEEENAQWQNERREGRTAGGLA